jgi:hypothetical protein
MKSTVSYDSALEQQVAQRYRDLGYEVIVHPTRGELPFDLGTYPPDLLVHKSDHEHFVIEVKGAPTSGEMQYPISVERYREIAEEVASYPGWRFLLVTEPDSLPGINGAQSGNIMTWRQISALIEQAEQLHGSGNVESAFLSLWSALEAAMRKRAEEINLPVDRLQTAALVDYLYSQGELSIEQYDKIVALHKSRTQLAHGFQTPGLRESTDKLSALVRELAGLWRPS